MHFSAAVCSAFLHFNCNTHRQCQHYCNDSVYKIYHVDCEDSPPVISEAPVNTTVVADDSVRFECIATGAPRPSITWSRGELLSLQ